MQVLSVYPVVACQATPSTFAFVIIPTVMTVAVAETLMDTLGRDGTIKAALVRSMQRWGHKETHGDGSLC